tara:strand:+ start:256 stop:720 length:465 start_codon:yes stop_codon:yes gene_type:complete
MGGDDLLREQLGRQLDGTQAHIRPRDVLDHFPLERINRTVPGVPHTPWRLVEHLRLAQRDILDYVSEGDYLELTFPDGYWPAEGEASETEWRSSVERFLTDLDALRTIARDPNRALMAPLPRNPEHTLLRELLIIGNHNSYHLGQLVVLQQAKV